MRQLLTIEPIVDPIAAATLRQKSEPIKDIDGVVREVAEFLEQQMSQMYQGRAPAGFAAPQFGELIRMLIFKRDTLTNLVIINPEIISAKGIQVKKEECYSLPGQAYIVGRPQIVKCRGLNLNGEVVTVKGRDQLAVILKHEVDHLDGILIDAIAERRLY